ncbi:MAG: hypothetical protein Ct9H300mP15_26810 [Gemmatimonadota bacterium]|nr:MAG: hypothetical protein Ct9H300mP15_26810 [Gemmatimonadota bacterium]
MREAYEVIYAPVVTEKSSYQMESSNIYTFIVNEDANKIEIGQGVEKLWDVTVRDVRTMRYSGKTKDPRWLVWLAMLLRGPRPFPF